MGKYFKLAWSGNITRNILEDFRNDVEKELHDKEINIGHWQSRHGDFNGDGKEDILLSYFDIHWDDSNFKADQNANGQLVLLLGNGTKGFKDGTSLLPHNGRLDGMSMQPTIADFNNDGVDDIILNNHNEDGRLHAEKWPSDQYAYFSTPGGDFTQIDLQFRTWGRSSVSGDFNNDGRLDFSVFGWTEDDNNLSYMYLQNADGGFDKTPMGYVGENVFVSGDFDGDGELEFAGFGGFYSEERYFRNQLWEINDDGSIGERTDTFEKPYKVTSDGRAINKLNGVEFLDEGLHFADTGDVNGDGADDVVAMRYGRTFDKKNGEYVNLKPFDSLSIYSGADGEGMKDTHATIKGWTAPKGVLSDIFLVDWNGDGHLDIFVNWADQHNGVSEAERVFLNDGTGDFARLAQKYLPGGSNRGMLEFGNYTDANNDGIMDVLVRPGEVYGGWKTFSEGLYLGTKRIASSNSVHNAAQDGAAGFNEDYYLNQMESGGKAMRSEGFESALQHYLSVGKASGAFGFAAGSHIYGYGGSETIILREGNESVDAFGGEDIITGAAGADILNGGKGTDTFVYLAVSDSGVTSDTRDIIEDFEAGIDRIDLSGIDAVAGTATNDAFSFLKADGATFTGEAGELRWYSTGSGANASRIIEADVDGDTVADVQIELAGAGTLNVADILL
jgi:hypothetical protein